MKNSKNISILEHSRHFNFRKIENSILKKIEENFESKNFNLYKFEKICVGLEMSTNSFGTKKNRLPDWTISKPNTESKNF